MQDSKGAARHGEHDRGCCSTRTTASRVWSRVQENRDSTGSVLVTVIGPGLGLASLSTSCTGTGRHAGGGGGSGGEARMWVSEALVVCKLRCRVSVSGTVRVHGG
eukprot:1788179-Rhodomonas_salina.1